VSLTNWTKAALKSEQVQIIGAKQTASGFNYDCSKPKIFTVSLIIVSKIISLSVTLLPFDT
jgi:hypothetical protein